MEEIIGKENKIRKKKLRMGANKRDNSVGLDKTKRENKEKRNKEKMRQM